MPRVHDERLALPVGKSILLWCIRTWVVGELRGFGTEDRIERMLARLGVPGAGPIGGLMGAVSHGATRRLAVQCVCRPGVSTDEHVLLDGVGLAQAMRPFEALLVFRELLSPEGARMALRQAERIGVSFRGAGHVLTVGEPEVRRRG